MTSPGKVGTGNGHPGKYSDREFIQGLSNESARCGWDKKHAKWIDKVME
jgi:hypothetical protein